MHSDKCQTSLEREDGAVEILSFLACSQLKLEYKLGSQVCELKSAYKWIMILNKLCDGTEVHMSPDSLCSDRCERTSVCLTPAASFFPTSRCMAACASVGEAFCAAGADLGHLCSSACITRPNLTVPDLWLSEARMNCVWQHQGEVQRIKHLDFFFF